MVRIAFRYIVLAAGFAAISANTGHADGPSEGKLNRSIITGSVSAPSVKPTEKDWRQETEATCGMTCRYHRANDNLTLQALYLVTKIQKIDEAIKNKNEGAARTALGAFCKHIDEDIGTCFGRYKDFQRVGLLEIRQAIGKNEDTIARLTDGRKSDGTVEGTALAFSTGVESTSYLPEVSTLAELEQSYLQGKLKPTGKAYTKDEIQKWSQSLVVNNPKTRYLEFSSKPVVGNPYQKEKTAYSLYMEKIREAGGNQGDARAVGLYQKSAQSMQDFATDKDKDLDPSTIKAVAVTKKLEKEDKVSYESFTEARSIVNSKIDGGAKKPDTSATRAPSGDFRKYGDDEKVEHPPEMKNSRYIKYDLGDMMRDIEGIDGVAK